MKSYLEIIDEAPEFLVKAFEKKHLREWECLRFLEEKQRRLAKFESRLTFWPFYGLACLVMVLATWFVCRFAQPPLMKIPLVLPGLLSICIATLVIFWFYYGPRLIMRNNLDRSRYISILDRFRDAVSAVAVGGKVFCDEAAIKGLLVQMACSVITHEEIVEKLRKDSSVTTEQLYAACGTLLQTRANLEKLFLVCSGEFGFIFKKSEMFTLAMSLLSDFEETSP